MNTSCLCVFEDWCRFFLAVFGQLSSLSVSSFNRPLAARQNNPQTMRTTTRDVAAFMWTITLCLQPDEKNGDQCQWDNWDEDTADWSWTQTTLEPIQLRAEKLIKFGKITPLFGSVHCQVSRRPVWGLVFCPRVNSMINRRAERCQTSITTTTTDLCKTKKSRLKGASVLSYPIDIISEGTREFLARRMRLCIYSSPKGLYCAHLLLVPPLITLKNVVHVLLRNTCSDVQFRSPFSGNVESARSKK